MRRHLFGSLLAAAALLMPVGAAGAVPPSPFQGAWETFDPPPDNSHNRMMIGGSLHVVYHEDGLTACENAYGQFVGGTGTADATVEGDVIMFELVVSCNLRHGKREIVGPFNAQFVYDDSTDTLTGGGGIVWTRVGS